jgi:hypothetical protein
MKILRFVLSLLCLIWAFSSAVAQEAKGTGWPVEERCVGEPTKTPEGWTFPGAILMTGHYGIHAVSADVPTPYVVAFLNQNQIVRNGAVLSLDGKWYAVLIGKQQDSSGTNVATQHIDEIRVYSTIKPRETYSIPWDHFDSVVGFSGAWDKLLWLDNQHILYPFDGDETPAIQVVDFIHGTSETWKHENFGLAYFADVVDFAPNLQHVVYSGIVEDVSSWLLAGSENTRTLGDIAAFANFVWRADSAGFAVEVQTAREDMIQSELAIFDAVGNRIEKIIDFQPSQTLRQYYGQQFKNIIWSPDGRYLAFITTTLNYPRVISLYIADMQQKKVIDTCIEPGDGLAWSPDGTQLAMIDFYDYKRQRPVMVLDMATWALYTVAYHDGSVIGWRGAEK